MPAAAIEKFVRYPALNSDNSYKWDQYLKKEQAQYLQSLPALELGPGTQYTFCYCSP